MQNGMRVLLALAILAAVCGAARADGFDVYPVFPLPYWGPNPFPVSPFPPGANVAYGSPLVIQHSAPIMRQMQMSHPSAAPMVSRGGMSR